MKALLIKEKQSLFKIFGLTELRSCEIDLQVVQSIDRQGNNLDIAQVELDVLSNLTNESEKAYLYYCIGRIGFIVEQKGTKAIIEFISNHIKSLQ